MLNSRKSLVQSNIQQFSPTKLTVDLQEARRLHRSRNRSTEYIQLQRFRKEQIRKQIQDLESSWTEFKKKKDFALDSERSISKSLNRYYKTAALSEASPEPAKGIQLVSRMNIESTQSPRKAPHRTQIYLAPNKTNKVNNLDSVQVENKLATSKIEKTIRRHRTNTPTELSEKQSEYLNKLFTNRIKNIFGTVCKKKQKPIQTAVATSNSRHKISCEDIGYSNQPSKIQSMCREHVQQIIAKQLKKVKIKKSVSNKEPTYEAPFEIRPLKTMDCSKMQIQSILFQKNASRIH